MLKWLVLFILCLSVRPDDVYAQSKDTSGIVVEGKIYDSIGGFSLPHATVALYLDSANTLLKYCLADNFGEFIFRSVPVRAKMSIVISYSGYKQKTIPVYTAERTNSLRLGRISLERSDGALEAAVVRNKPPVVMHNDTLEFNADAISLDSSSVAEDLLTRLPGVVVWADGSITVNGEEVKNVKVNGKPFFGGDTKVATRNIPKTAIEKVQVYKQKQDYDSRYDSSMEINFKLKEGAASGYFGKIGAGYGTRQRYDADGSFNYYTPLTQLGIVGATNNINKAANDVNTLLRNNTFKDQQATLDYQSDFRMEGVNQPNAVGMVFQHDFIPDANYFKNNRLSGNYLFNNNNITIQRNTLMKTYLGADSSQTQGNSNSSLSGNSKHNLAAEYNYHYDKLTLSLKPGVVVNDTYNHSSGNTYVLGTNDTLSKNRQVISEYSGDKNFSLAVKYQRNFMLGYTIGEENTHQQQYKKSDYSSLFVPESNFSINRTYSKKLNNNSHHLEFKSPDIAQVFKKSGSFVSPVWGVNIYAVSDVNYMRSDRDNKVADFDSSDLSYSTNGYLSDKGKYNEVHVTPGIVLSKTFLKTISNRYNKDIQFSFTSPFLYFHQNNSSTEHPELNFNRQSFQYTPEFDFSYTNQQIGDYTDSYLSAFKTEKYFPLPDQLYTLIDSSNPYYLQLGNPRLNPYTKNTLSFLFRHESNKSKNTLSYSAGVNLGYIDNTIVDSAIIESDGKTYHYYANGGNSRFLNLTGELKKAIKSGPHAFQLSVRTVTVFQRDPSYTNAIRYITNSLNSNQTAEANYSYRNLLSIFIKESFSIYKSAQQGTGNSFQYRTASTSFNIDGYITRQLAMNTNAAYNRYVSESFNSTSSFLWNAACSYRVLKGRNLEFRIAALDILRQNKGVLNYGSTTSISQGNVNVLRNYYSFSVYFFPKHFGQ